MVTTWKASMNQGQALTRRSSSIKDLYLSVEMRTFSLNQLSQ